MDEKLYLAIDQGSHASRAIVYNEQGQALAEAVQDISTKHDREGHIEHDPVELLDSVNNTVIGVIDQLGKNAKQIVACGLATQRSTIACWDKESGKPLAPIISWQDRRAHKEVKKFESYAEEIHQKTGLFLTPHYGASKLRWCFDNIPAVRKALDECRLCCGPLASFLLFHLLEKHPYLVDPANASRTQLWNIENKDWDAELLQLFGIPPQLLPQCVPTRYDFGNLAIGNHGIPLRICTGDQNAAIFSYGSLDHDTTIINIGTGAFILRPTAHDKIYAPRLLTGIALQTAKESFYVLEGTVNGAGSALSWAAEKFELNNLLQKLETWLQVQKDLPLFLNGISGLGSPFWDPDFKSHFIGEGSVEAKAAAVAESILFLIKANLDEMDNSTTPTKKLIVTGGVANNDVLCQCLANLGALPVYRPGACEATARGTAYLIAGQPKNWPEFLSGTNFFSDVDKALQQRYQNWHKAMVSAI